MNKYLVLVEDVNLYPSVQGVDIFQIYSSCNKLLRGIRYLHHKCGWLSGLKMIWLSCWKTDVHNYSDIIIVDSIYDYTPLKFIRDNNPNVRIVFCFRNRVNERIGHSTLNRDPIVLRGAFSCELWSYSDTDCKDFKMRKYNQFYLIPDCLRDKKKPLCYDAYFIGIDKHRMAVLKELKSLLEKMGLITRIEIVADPRQKYNKEDSKLLVKMRPYSDVLNIILRSRCIIDIVVDNNFGMTYRCLEACFLKKKLITNYSDIIYADFYNKNNVFILGKDDWGRIKEFVLSPYDESNWSIIYQYSFKHFCESVFNEVHKNGIS